MKALYWILPFVVVAFISWGLLSDLPGMYVLAGLFAVFTAVTRFRRKETFFGILWSVIAVFSFYISVT